MYQQISIMSSLWKIETQRNFVHYVVGKVQSGKTGAIINVVDELLAQNITPIIVIRNRKCDVEQLVARFPGEIQTVYGVWPTGSKTPGIFDPNKPCIVMGNASQLTKIHSILMESGTDYTMVCDEGDLHYQTKSRDKKPTEKAFQALKVDSNNVFSFTATVASLIKNEKGPHRVYDMELSSDYFGVDHFEHSPVYSNKTYDFDSHCLCDIPDMTRMYNEASSRVKTWAIHNTDRRRFVQYAISDWVCDNYKKFVVITYNGDGTIVKVPIKDEESGELTGHHKTLTFENVPIGKILTMCKEYKHLTIICGELATRGISFVSDDYSVHCDFQYFRCLNQNPHGEQLLQACRLSGVYKDSTAPKLKFFCEEATWELIKKHFDYSNQSEDSYQVYRELPNSEHVCRPQLS